MGGFYHVVRGRLRRHSAIASSERTASRQARPCYKLEMHKPLERWLLFQYIDGKVTVLSKEFKTKQLAEKARLKYPERERKKIGVGVAR